MRAIFAIDIGTGLIGNSHGHHGLPWNIPEELAFFKKETQGNDIIVGHNTWVAMGCRPLPNRKTFVITRDTFIQQENVESYESLSMAAEVAKDAVLIGGAKLLTQALSLDLIDEMTVSVLSFIVPVVGDVYLDLDTVTRGLKVDESNRPTHYVKNLLAGYEGQVSWCVNRYYKAEEYRTQTELREEAGYIHLLAEIIKQGIYTQNRTGINCYTLYGRIVKYDMSYGAYPLLTHKKVAFKSIVRELLWFISGSTDNEKLTARGCHIWTGNSTKEFLQKRNLPYEQNDLGPVYGFQWRHWGAEYTDRHANYQNKGIDQLVNIIETIKSDPTSRRMILSAWNVSDLDKMALPPCHSFCQFFVSEGKLSCLLYQRSCDMGLGVPFNIASYALLLLLICRETNLKPGEFMHSMGQLDIYENHFDQMRMALKRQTFPFPQIRFTETTKSIFEIEEEDIILENYLCGSPLPMEMAV